MGCLYCVWHNTAVATEPIHPVLSFTPNALWGMDFLSPFPWTPCGHTYIFHLINYFSSFTVGYPMKDAGTSTAISGLSYTFQHLPIPVEIYCDPGPHFTSLLMAHYLELKGVKLSFHASGLSQVTGKIENVGCWVQSVIQKHINSVTDWDLELPQAYENVNNQVISHL